MKAITRHIPNTITSLNLLAGCISIVFSSIGDFKMAAYLIFAAAIFDFFDGFAARLLKAHSPIGLQLDSLADVVSFGIAPSIMLVYSNLHKIHTGTTMELIVAGFPFLIAIFSALRLAKFNIDTRQTETFIGMPTPACAILIASAMLYASYNYNYMSVITNPYLIIVLSIILSYLLVCEIPMFSLKMKKQENSEIFTKKYAVQLIFLIASLLFIIIFRFGGITMSILLYILISISKWLASKATTSKS